MMSSFTCPKCNHADMIQKVSAIVAEQTHEIYGSSLARKLERPSKPELPQPPVNGCSTILMVIGAAVGLLASLPCLFLLLFFLVGMISAPFSTQPSLDTWNMPARILTSVAGIIISVGVLVVVIIIGVVVLKNMSSSSKMVAEEHEREVARVQAEIENWKQANDNWDQLYYCRRDDIVFIPSRNTWASIDEMMAYLST